MTSLIETLNTVPGEEVFTFHFLHSLSTLRSQKPFRLNNTNYRVRKIKTAAYASMARAAGGKSRSWSKALLWRLRGRAKDNKGKGLRMMKRRRVAKRSGHRGGRPRWRRTRPSPDEATDRLRKLVPGGGEMETFRLMEETAHYMKCLSMQVKVMQCLVDGLSA